MNKTKTAPRKDLTREHVVKHADAIELILAKLDKHFKTVEAILDSSLLGVEEDTRFGLTVAQDNLREEVAELELKTPYDEMLQDVVKHDDFDSEEAIKAIADEVGEIDVWTYFRNKGFAIIKIDNILDEQKLREFVTTELYPLYSDREKYEI